MAKNNIYKLNLSAYQKERYKAILSKLFDYNSILDLITINNKQDLLLIVDLIDNICFCGDKIETLEYYKEIEAIKVIGNISIKKTEPENILGI